MKVVWHYDHFPGVDLWKLAGDGLPRLLQCVACSAVDGFAIDDLAEDFESVLHAKRDEVSGVAAVIVAFKANAASMVDARVVCGAHVPKSNGRATSGRIPQINPLFVMRRQIRPFECDVVSQGRSAAPARGCEWCGGSAPACAAANGVWDLPLRAWLRIVLGSAPMRV